MVAAELEVMAQAEVNSPALTTIIDPHHNPRNNNGNGESNNSNYVFPSLGRQSSIYSLTLDEFQNTLSENGKNFGSMNMDEFLNSIWTAEENQAHHTHNQEHPNNSIQLPAVSVAASSSRRGVIAKQPSLPRQGSLTLPAPLCRKTVDEVWTEIQGIRLPEDEQQNNQQQQQVVNANNDAQRQATFGEMTLEDFLVKAGVVREQCGGTVAPAPLAVAPPPPPAQHPSHHQYGFSAPQMAPTFVTRPMMAMAPGAAYQPMPPSAGESSGYTGNGKRNNGYPTPAVGSSVACYGGRMTNGGPPSGAFAPGPGLSPVSPVSPEGMCGPGQVDNPGGQYGLDMAALRGRKRIIDGPVEKVVERRQRRMIKNRESAARSRARKQAYTVELEAELNQLREENAQLKQALEEIERERKQQYHEEQNIQVILSRAQRAQDKLRTMRRSQSCTL